MKIAQFFDPIQQPISVWQEVAARNDLVYFPGWNNSNAQQFARYLQRLGANTFQYQNSESTMGRTTRWDYNYMLATHPEWFIYAESSSPSTIVEEKNYNDNCIVNMLNPDFRAWWISRIVEKFQDWGFGAFLDVVCSCLEQDYYDTDPNPMYAYPAGLGGSGTEITNENWSAAFLAFLTELRPEGITTCINGIWSGYKYYTFSNIMDDLIPLTDYVMFEGFLRSAGTGIETFESETLWVYNINYLTVLGDKALIYLQVGVPATIAQLARWFYYSFASYFLGCTVNSHFMWRNKTETTLAKDYWPEMKRILTTIGTPSESFTDIADAKDRLTNGTNTYHRAFSDGLVLVNPTASNDSGVVLGGTYYDENGDAQTSVDMDAHTGKILTTSY